MKPYHLRYLLVLTTLLAASCAKNLFPAAQSHQYYVINQTIAADSQLMALLAPYKIGVDTQMKVVIGRTDNPLTKAQPESTLGNFMADAQLKSALQIDKKVVASVSNYGAIRLPMIPTGPLTRGTMYELMPFDNKITIIDIPGTVLKQFCDHMARAKGWPVSGIRYTIKDGKATDITISGASVNDHIIYKVAVNDYIARGGDNCDFLVPLKKRYTTIFVRDALINYVEELQKRGQPLNPQIENRVQYAE